MTAKLAIITAILTAAPSSGIAAESAAPPVAMSTATQPNAIAEGSTLVATVTAVNGQVQVREKAGDPWKKVEQGMSVDAGAELRTGPRSAVTVFVEPGQVFTLDRLGTVRLMEAIKTGGKFHTELLMRYGRTALQVEAAGQEHDAKIRSPSSTLAVRGTQVALYDQPPYNTEAVSFTGRAAFISANREVALGGKHLARVEGLNSDPAATALSATVVDPQVAAARSSSDARFVTNETSRGALSRFDSATQIQTISGGAGPILNDTAFAATLPGTFALTVRWTGNADINIVGTHESGDALTILGEGYLPTEILFPGYGLDKSPTGGTVPLDHRGGPNGGTEIAYWSKPPAGFYGISAQHTSGGPATVTLAAFYQGKPINIYSFDTGGLTKGRTIVRTIDKGGDASVVLPFPIIPDLEAVVPDDTGLMPARAASRAASSRRIATVRQKP